MRALRAEIDLQAIRHNYALAKAQLPGGRAVAVIKANAYGHGATRVAEALGQEADAFGVACIEEAIELRQSGVVKPIWLLEGFFHNDELVLIDELRLSTAIHSDYQIEAFKRHSFKKPVDVWLKMDSGMHRLGFAPEVYASAFAQLQGSPGIAQLGKMTHFACADEPARGYTERQWQRFDEVCSALPGPVSASNSPATLYWPMAHGDWLRPGLMLYGISPFAPGHELGDQLKPAMRMVSEIIAVRELPAGEPVGYGGRFRTSGEVTRVGVVAMGYGDGYPRQALDGTPVIVDGVKTRLIGRVSMDMLMVDLTPVPQAGIYSEVVLWGEDSLRVEEVSGFCDAIPYELVTRLTGRAPLVYKNA
ncbi:alanine racemase [Pokkaliibacter sp. CJK22405]|uniref:alanine racemase n=1 Tax=Pokkaliibacter sp. CJK22405 TaxID=3384615 RepID=UPI003984DF46